jgi:raffinose/stachyose/melibiose transport system permease protein
MSKQTRTQNNILFVFLYILAVAYMLSIFIVFMNSFKGRFFISDAPFELPNEQNFVRLENYTSGIAKIGFIQAFGYSLFITVVPS